MTKKQKELIEELIHSNIELKRKVEDLQRDVYTLKKKCLGINDNPSISERIFGTDPSLREKIDLIFKYLDVEIREQKASKYLQKTKKL